MRRSASMNEKYSALIYWGPEQNGRHFAGDIFKYAFRISKICDILSFL